MKKLFTTILACLAVTTMMAQGWPENYGGVMLQGFYWDYYDDPDWGTWSALEGQANDLEGYIDLIWVPNSARTKNDYCVQQAQTDRNWLKDMGYMPCWWLNHDNTIFGNSTQLKSMIDTYKSKKSDYNSSKGIGIIEDVVINHKNGENSWCDFPNEEVKVGDKTYKLEWSLADICQNDNGGYVSTMFDVTGAYDTGDDFDGCRDLDHTGANVQNNVKTYLNYLKDELGYAGFRYDMVKGYNPLYVGIYNAAVNPEFSVGEFWDDWGGTTWWVSGTTQDYAVQSAAFDFPLKFLINNAFTGSSFNQSALSTQGMAGDDFFKRYSVTFVDNHDTYRDGTCMSNEKHVLAANAFILSMPGTPCIFLPHWKTHKGALKRMIRARKLAGITNQSTFESYECNNGGGRSFVVHGSDGDILLLLGNCGEYDTSGYSSVWNGDVNNWDFQMFVSNSVADDLNNKVRVDKASGTYYQSVTVNVSPTDNSTTLLYTEDGNDPTASSSTIANGGQSFTYNTVGTYTLKVGVKDGESVTDIQTYTYTITNEEIPDFTIYVRADKNPVYLHAWDGDGDLTSWPGVKLSDMKSVNGVNFYYKTFPKKSEGYKLNYLLNQGGDDTKTPDQTGIGSDIFTALGDKTVENLTSTYENKSIESAVYKDITVYVKATQGGMKLHAWNASGDLTSGDEKLTDVILVKDCAWYRKTFTNQNLISFLVYHDDIGTYKSNDFTNVTSDIFVTYVDDNGNRYLTDNTADYFGYTPAWYEQGEVCAFFEIPNGWFVDWNTICSYAYNGETKYTDPWDSTTRGDVCDFLGYNENGSQIWKWTCTKNVTGQPKTIIFNSASNSNQTENLEFANGAWYSATSYLGSNNKIPISTAVEPSEEISVVALGNPTTATNWNGDSEKVAEKGANETMSKEFSLEAGSYIVQAIVRGTSGSSVTLSAKEQEASVTLTGLDGASSTVHANGFVDTYEPGTNNGWQKVEVAFTLNEATKVKVTLSSAAAQWQLGTLKVLPGTTNTKATTDPYIDLSNESDFSFFERGENRNALIKAAANTLPALLPYNVIIGSSCSKLQLTDGNYSFNNSGEAFTASSVSYDRTFEQSTTSTRGESEQYKTSTICLPFGLTATEAAEAGTFWGLESFDSSEEEINFVEVTEPQANVPYIFEPAKAKPFTSLTNKTIPTSSSLIDTKDGVSFVGVNARTHLKSDATVTYYGYKNGTFVKVGTENGANVNPFRAYLQIPGVQSLSRIGVLFDGEYSVETGIQVVKPAAELRAEQPIYNLSGQRVKTPNQKGIYIKGGKKFVIK